MRKLLILFILFSITYSTYGQKKFSKLDSAKTFNSNSGLAGTTYDDTDGTYEDGLFSPQVIANGIARYLPDTSSGGSPFIDSVRLADTTKLLTHKIDSVAGLITAGGMPGGNTNSIQRDSAGYFAGNNDFIYLPGTDLVLSFSGHHELFSSPGDDIIGDVDNASHGTVWQVHDASQEIIGKANTHIVLNSDTATLRVNYLKIPYLAGATQIAADGNGSLYSTLSNTVVAKGELKGIVNATDTIYRYFVPSDTDHSYTVDAWINITAIAASSMVIQIYYTNEMNVAAYDDMNANVGGNLTQIFSAQAEYHCFGMMIRARKGTKIVVLASLNSGAVCTYNAGSALTDKD